MIWATWANALSVLRLLLAAPCAYAIWSGAWWSAVVLFTLAVLTDVFDGIVARRRGQATPLGGLLDHSIDAVFVTTMLGALALIGVVPALLPPLVIVVRAIVWIRSVAGRTAARERVGSSANGIAFTLLVGTVIVRNALGLGWPSPALLNQSAGCLSPRR